MVASASGALSDVQREEGINDAARSLLTLVVCPVSQLEEGAGTRTAEGPCTGDASRRKSTATFEAAYGTNMFALGLLAVDVPTGVAHIRGMDPTQSPAEVREIRTDVTRANSVEALRALLRELQRLRAAKVRIEAAQQAELDAAYDVFRRKEQAIRLKYSEELEKKTRALGRAEQAVVSYAEQNHETVFGKTKTVEESGAKVVSRASPARLIVKDAERAVVYLRTHNLHRLVEERVETKIDVAGVNRAYRDGTIASVPEGMELIPATENISIR